jgi:hypothetical protein
MRATHIYIHMLKAWLDIGRFVPTDNISTAWRKIASLYVRNNQGVLVINRRLVQAVYDERLVSRLTMIE